MSDQPFTPTHPAEPLVLSRLGARIRRDEVIFGDSSAPRWNLRDKGLSLVVHELQQRRSTPRRMAPPPPPAIPAGAMQLDSQPAPDAPPMSEAAAASAREMAA
ncbi:MAG TPA: hypothetical protein VEV20_02525, partial [Burkholderiales bacterium]|nr:hypothetical protein [Burkholderiales bacterium]